jgi:hypothetical protein
MNMTRKNEHSVLSVPRGLAMAVGVLCLLIALASAIVAVLLLYGIVVRKVSVDRTVVIPCGVLVLLALSFTGVGWRLCRISTQNTAPASGEASAKYNKLNDAHWCMGVFGIVGGMFMILLNLRAVVDLIRSRALEIFALLVLTVGVQSYLTWRRERRFFVAIQEWHRSTDNLVSTESSVNETDALRAGEGEEHAHPMSPPAAGA